MTWRLDRRKKALQQNLTAGLFLHRPGCSWSQLFLRYHVVSPKRCIYNYKPENIQNIFTYIYIYLLLKNTYIYIYNLSHYMYILMFNVHIWWLYINIYMHMNLKNETYKSSWWFENKKFFSTWICHHVSFEMLNECSFYKSRWYNFPRCI